MSEEKCQFCGMIGCETKPVWNGSSILDVKLDCALRQLMQTKDKISQLQEKLDAWREGKDYFSWSPYQRIQWRKKLKELGELS